MKKILCTTIVLVLIGTMIFGQEPEGNEQQTQTGQQPAGGQVAIGIGTLKYL